MNFPGGLSLIISVLITRQQGINVGKWRYDKRSRVWSDTHGRWRKGPQDKEYRWQLKAGKVKEMNSQLEASSKSQLYRYLESLTSRTVR